MVFRRRTILRIRIVDFKLNRTYLCRIFFFPVVNLSLSPDKHSKCFKKVQNIPKSNAENHVLTKKTSNKLFVPRRIIFFGKKLSSGLWPVKIKNTT